MLQQSRELFQSEWKKTNYEILGGFNIETTDSLDIDEFAALGAKAYVYTDDNGKDREKLEGIRKFGFKGKIFNKNSNC